MDDRAKEPGTGRKITYSDIQEMLGALRQKILLGTTKGFGLEHVSGSAISLEHRLIDHVSHV